MARIVLTTFGSYGDVFPYVAIAKQLAERGHATLLAAPATYCDFSEREGIAFTPIRPDVDYSDADAFRRAMDPKRGAEVIVREALLPYLRDSYHDLELACDGADLLLSHVLTFAAPILGEKQDLPWLSTILMPMVFASSYDPPALAPIPWLARLRPLGPTIIALLWRVMRRVSRSWSDPIRELRRELGLADGDDPLWGATWCPDGVLALFSSTLATPQPDWPAATTVCGFPFLDEDFAGNEDAADLNGFLAEHEAAPLVFSLGSSAARTAGSFYAIAAASAKELDRPAVLVVGDAEPPSPLPRNVIAIRSAEVHTLFPRAAAIVHAGGVGSTGQAMRAGKPQLIVPFSHDQFDNGVRIERRSLGASIPRKRLSVRRLVRRLRTVLEDAEIATCSRETADVLAGEDGVGCACDAIERVLERRAACS